MTHNIFWATNGTITKLAVDKVCPLWLGYFTLILISLALLMHSVFAHCYASFRQFPAVLVLLPAAVTGIHYLMHVYFFHR